MGEPQPFSTLSTADLATTCCNEMDRYQQQKKSNQVYCLELFRRALASKQEDAWERLLNGCIADHVHGCFYGHPRWQLAHRYQQAEFYVVESFLRLWRSSLGHVLRIESLGEMLSLLARCLHCAIMEEIRLWEPPNARGRAANAPAPEDTQHWPAHTTPSAEPMSASDPSEDAIMRERVREVWECAKTQYERRIFTLRWRLGYTPQEMAKRWPKHYPSPSKISETLQNILARYYRRRRKLDES
jgi:hypothetical protein